MPETIPADLVPGATDVVEALTAEAAIAAVHERFGPDARLLDARRVLRGGIGGFFAKEHVQLHVAPGAPVAAPPPPRTSGPAHVGRRALDRFLADVEEDDLAAARSTSPVDRLLDGAMDQPAEVDFATYLRRQLGTDQPAGAAGHVPAADAPATAGDTAGSDDATAELLAQARAKVLWAAAASHAADRVQPAPWLAGVPAASNAVAAATSASVSEPATASAPQVTLAAGVDVTSGTDRERAHDVDPMWAAVATPHVAPATEVAEQPTTDGSSAGWSTTELSRLGLPIDLVRSLEVRLPPDDLAWTAAIAEAVQPLCRPLPDGAAVLVGPRASELTGAAGLPAARSATWRAALGGERWRHLVLGGDGWRDVLRDEVLAVSWTDPADLPEALRCATELGLVLGFGPLGGGTVWRATPLEVALAVRALVVTR